jgi:hypothetical protein
MNEPLLWPMVESRDGRLRPGTALTPAERACLVEICHHLAHVCGYSQSQVKRYLDDRGAPRAASTIGRYLAQPCERCRAPAA